MAGATLGARPPGSPLVGTASRRRNEALVRIVLTSGGLTSIAISVAIILSLVYQAFVFITSIDLGQLVAPGWFPRRGQFDLLTLILGTGIVALIAMLLAGPIGLAGAVYLSEYASPRTRRTVKPILEILAGVPSVVLGFFALTWISPNVVQSVFPTAGGFNFMAAALGVGILTIPLVASISEDAMRAVPASLREASYGLGARRITTTMRVVLPAAVSGVMAALILAISRTIGETMVVAVAAGATGGSLRTVNPLGPGQTLTAAMASLATGSDQVTGDSAAYLSLFFLGLLLFAATFLLNGVADIVVRRTRQKY
jgi:phosphate transport system permease protein